MSHANLGIPASPAPAAELPRIAVAVDGFGAQLKLFQFPGGEVQVRLEEFAFAAAGREAEIYARLLSSADVMALLLVTDALRRRYRGIKISLICRYLPYARQDRVCAPGEALSLKVFCDLINAQRYEEVEVWDVHSDVALALLDRVRHVTAAEILVKGAAIATLEKTCVIAPDAGAAKRAAAVAKVIGAPLLIQAEKVRNPKTGEIERVFVHLDGIHPMEPMLVVDDICDGGRTFIELSKVLRGGAPTRPTFLYVTHGIFSNGFAELGKWFDRIYVANPLFEKSLAPDYVKFI